MPLISLINCGLTSVGLLSVRQEICSKGKDTSGYFRGPDFAFVVHVLSYSAWNCIQADTDIPLFYRLKHLEARPLPLAEMFPKKLTLNL
jgi:hypothetical protein